MTKKTIKTVSALAAFAVFGFASSALAGNSNSRCGECAPVKKPKCEHTHGHTHMAAESHMGSAAMFTAKGAQTQEISIGGYIQTAYVNASAEDNQTSGRDTFHHSNFSMQHVRLCVDAEIGDGWSGLMNVDFGCAGNGTGADCCTCKNTSGPGSTTGVYDQTTGGNCQGGSVYVDKAYIQKVWEGHTFRAGYQKVPFGVEEVTPEPDLKSIARGVATRYFINANKQLDGMPYPSGSSAYGTVGSAGLIHQESNGFGSRHVGLFAHGDFGLVDQTFHYTAAIVNGRAGDCCFSDKQNNELGFFGGLAVAFMVRDADLMLGLNGGYKPEGNTWALGGQGALNPAQRKADIWALNPYLMMQLYGFNLMTEFFYMELEHGKANKDATAKPWGWTIMPSYMFEDQWEFVFRYSYVDTDHAGTTLRNAAGCTPGFAVNGGSAGIDNIAAFHLFDEASSWYFGVNYYLMNKAIKASIGFEHVDLEDRFVNAAGTTAQNFGSNTAGNKWNGKDAEANIWRAALQLVF